MEGCVFNEVRSGIVVVVVVGVGWVSWVVGIGRHGETRGRDCDGEFAEGFTKKRLVWDGTRVHLECKFGIEARYVL